MRSRDLSLYPSPFLANPPPHSTLQNLFPPPHSFLQNLLFLLLCTPPCFPAFPSHLFIFLLHRHRDFLYPLVQGWSRQSHQRNGRRFKREKLQTRPFSLKFSFNLGRKTSRSPRYSYTVDIHVHNSYPPNPAYKCANTAVHTVSSAPFTPTLLPFSLFLILSLSRCLSHPFILRFGYHRKYNYVLATTKI